MYVILFGPPGSGKGTQSKVIESKLGLSQLSTGDLVRREIASGSEVGKMIAESVSKGDYLRDDVIFGLFKRAFRTVKSGFIFDGFPRTMNQVKLLEDFLAERGEEVSTVILLDVADDVLIKRLSGRFSCKSCGALYNEHFKPTKVAGVCDACGSKEFDRRADDASEAVKTRLEVYKSQTKPLIEYFSDAGKLVRVDGSQDLQVISSEILRCLEQVKAEQDLARSMS